MVAPAPAYPHTVPGAWEHPTCLSKRNGERFFLQWSAVWILVFALIVGTDAYERFSDTHYLLLGLFVAVPPAVLPILFPDRCDDASLPLARRYTTKANLWIGIYSFVGSYFLTHYFYTVLHVRYTVMYEQRLNDVPVALYLITHGYFVFYHVAASRLLRALEAHLRPSSLVSVRGALAVLALGYATAFLEAFTIQRFPYYTYPDQRAMLSVGSLFYALYLVVSYPAFYRLDEVQVWTLGRAAWDSLAACMLIMTLLDGWRVVVGPIQVHGEVPNTTVVCKGLVWGT